MRNLNLFVAVFWLVVGVGLVLWQWGVGAGLWEVLDPGSQPWQVRGTGWSLGWLGIVLAAYNLVRWYQMRCFFQQKAQDRERLRRVEEKMRRRPEVTPDPNFDFSDVTAADKGRIKPGEKTPEPETQLTDLPPPSITEERRD